jgi:hypothetical protein
MHKNQITHKYTLSGVYKITFPDCKKVYVGQTGRSFAIRFIEHKNAFRSNNHTSRFVQRLIEHARSLDTNCNTTQVLHYQSKGAYPNTYEGFYINAERITNNQLNDNQTISPSKISDTVLKPHRPQKPPPHPLRPSKGYTPHKPKTGIKSILESITVSKKLSRHASHAMNRNSEHPSAL